MTILITLFIFVLAYAIAKFLLMKVPAVVEIADILALGIGVLVALLYAGVVHV